MKTPRQLKGESILQKAIMEIIAKTFGFVASVSSIDLSPDFKYAKVYLLKLNDQFDFNMLTKVIKSKLGKSISFRSTPKLDFAMQDLTDDNWLDKIN